MYNLLLQQIKNILDGMSADLPLCNAMSTLLGRIFKCDYVFIFLYNERWKRVIERVLRTSPEIPYIDFKPGVIGPELVRSAIREPFMLDPQTTEKIGLSSNASVMVVSTGENLFLRGAIAVAKENGTAWNKGDLEQLGIITLLILRCYELSVSLADNQQYANTIVESVDTAIFAVSTEGEMIHFNRAAEKVYGFPASEAIGKHYSELLSPKEKELTRRTFEYVINTGKPWEGQFVEFTRVDNKVIFISPTIYPWLNSEGTIMGAIVIVRDDTETKHFQEQLVRIEKMAILGQIAAQVSHEVRSPLASIRGFARIIEKNEKNGSTYKDYAATIVEQVDRINSVVQELLDFSRPEAIKRQTIDINLAIRKALKSLEIDRARVNIIENYDKKLPAFKGDYQKIERVFVNLLQNSLQAVKDSGTINISTGKTPDNRISITFKDDGCGIPGHFINKIFDPYFTTKDNGTGLGLAIVQQIVSNHGGKIQVTSDSGLGTSFEIELPLERNKADGQ